QGTSPHGPQLPCPRQRRRHARRRRLQLPPPPRMAEAFVAQNPDCVQPNHPAQIRLKSGSSRATTKPPRTRLRLTRPPQTGPPQTRPRAGEVLLEQLRPGLQRTMSTGGAKESDEQKIPLPRGKPTPKRALPFRGAQPEADAARLGIYGTSYGGATVVFVAAIDPRVKCVVSVVGIG